MDELYFSEVFDVPEATLERHGAFNISLLVDLPLFIDPFLLFNSRKPEYQALHAEIISYLRFLRDLAAAGTLSAGARRHLFCFSEVKQTWLGFSTESNRGRGLGMKFANALADNLHNLFNSFGSETITKGSHLEKLCLIRDGVGRDMISDFTTNLVLPHLCTFTQEFARKHLEPKMCAEFAVNRVAFDKTTARWMPGRFFLPRLGSDYVLLTPKDILTKDDTWINKEDFVREFHDIPTAIGDTELRDRVESYFRQVLPRNPNRSETGRAVRLTALKFPVLYDYYIRTKEDSGHLAESSSLEKVVESHAVYVRQFRQLIGLLRTKSEFYLGNVPRSKDEAIRKVRFLKDVIENKGGHRIFYRDGQPIRREEDLQILYRLVWHDTLFDVSREVNDGRGPADFKISQGAADKTIVEMKLASNSSLRRNLENQAEIYQRASDAASAIKVILFFTLDEKRRVEAILRELKLDQSQNVIQIDARDDNKPSASKA